jgi:deoxycytidylate deaminase
MRYLVGEEEKEALVFLEETVKVANKATCLRSKCGSIIVKEKKILGIGYNSLPGDECPKICIKSVLDEAFKSDKTCCIHAEDRAVRDALKKHGEKIIGSRLYFIRLDKKGEMSRAGKPYCTMCSKMALDSGIKEFVLYHKEGICVYDTKEYNTLSFQYPQ